MNRSKRGFSLVEMMIALAISAVLIAATWAVVASVIQGDENNRVRVELQLEAATALRKISDLLKMSGPTGTITAPLGANDYPVFAIDQAGGGFTGNYTFLNSANYQTVPPNGSNPVTNDAVKHLAPSTDIDGYYGTSNEIAFKIPRPVPWKYPSGVQNSLDNTGVPIDLTGAVTWGVTDTLYAYYLANGGNSVADRQTDVYAIVLVPTTSFEKDASGNAVAGPNQLELREYSHTTPPLLIRKSILASGVERIVFKACGNAPISNYYQAGLDPLTGESFNDANLGNNEMSVTIWMWRNNLNKKSSGSISAYRVKQSVTVNLRSVGKNGT